MLLPSFPSRSFRSLKTRVWEQGGSFCCQLEIPLKRGGDIKVLAVVTSKEILASLKRAGLRFARRAGRTFAMVRGVDCGEVSGFFSSIGKFVKKIAKNKVLRKAISIGKKIVKSPIVRAIVPQAAMAIDAAEGAAKLIRMATSKRASPAQQKKARVAILAARGQADREKAAQRSLPMPRSLRSSSPAARNTYRYLVQVAHAA